MHTSAMVSCYLLGWIPFTVFLLTTSFSVNLAQSVDIPQPEVTIPQGTLRGTTLTTRFGRKISAFIGIPYAKPPIGDLRFANPVAADGWTGTLDATVDKVVCPQQLTDVVFGDEDCLYLSVYVPQNATPSSLPVMAYVHGGAFQRGSQTTTNNGSPKYLLDADVILVGMSYRLGPLGFLSTGDKVASGNWGLKDQVLALQWIQDNIMNFGGDPNQVTIFGNSAGASSIHHLTLVSSTVGLFHRYITSSGTALGFWAHRPRAAYASTAFKLGKFVGCDNDTSNALINCLRTVSSADIISTRSKFFVWQSFPDITWGPTDEPDIEGALMTESPTDLFAAGKFRDLPWIVGVVRDEGLLQTSAFYRDEKLFQEFLKNIDLLLPIMFNWVFQPDSGASWTKAAKSFYFNNNLTSDTSMVLRNLTILVSDVLFFYPAYKALQKQHASAVNPQYFYYFNYEGTFTNSYARKDGSTVNIGIGHGDDSTYLFLKESLTLSNPNKIMSEQDYQIVDTMVQLWTSFAIKGIPTASTLGNTIWKPYSTNGNFLRIGNGPDVTSDVQYLFFKERMDFWAKLYTDAKM